MGGYAPYRRDRKACVHAILSHIRDMAHVLRPARGMVLLEPMAIKQGLVFVPANANDELKRQYVVKAVGKGRIVKPKKNKSFLLLFPEVKVGDVVLANRYAGHPIEINGRPHRLVHDDSIMAVIGLDDSDPRLAPEPASPQFGSS